jgi:hypothetical protein
VVVKGGGEAPVGDRKGGQCTGRDGAGRMAEPAEEDGALGSSRRGVATPWWRSEKDLGVGVDEWRRSGARPTEGVAGGELQRPC